MMNDELAPNRSRGEIRLACDAMATRFEWVLHGRDPVALRAAGDEAIAEVRRIESLLSVYRPESEIAALNRGAALAPVRVSPEVFRLLQHAQRLSLATAGAFDVTVGPLLRVWGLMHGSGRVPATGEIEAARACVGAELLEGDEAGSVIRFLRPGVMVDLGSIGKGYALDRAAELLREAGVEHALIHGGTSTAVAWGRAPDGGAWKVAIAAPSSVGEPGSHELAPLAVVSLDNESLSVSAVWGKGFEAEGRFYGHVIDPRRGEPVQGALLAAMVLPSATESDALSTALLVGGEAMVERLRAAQAPARCLVVLPTAHAPGYRFATSGISVITR